MKRLLKDSQGMALVVAVLITAILLAITGASLFFSQLDLKMASNHKTGTMAFHVADAGISHAIQTLTVINGSTDFQTVSAVPTPLLSNVSFGVGSYSVIGEPVAGSSPKRVKLTSTGCLPGGDPCPSGNSKAVIEVQVDNVNLPLPGTITLIGPSADFTGGESAAKLLSGDEGAGCGSAPSLPVVAVTDAASKCCGPASVQTIINNSKLGTYVTSYAGGKTDDVKASGAIDNIKSQSGFDLTNGNDLTVLVSKIQKRADSVVAGGATSVDLGSVGNERVVVVNGDLTLSGNTSGAGILVVKGKLTLNGNISYTGVILVIGSGVMQRNGGGSGTISGGIIVAKVAGGVIGSGPTLKTNGAGNSTIQYCSSGVNKAFSKLVEMLAWKQSF
ncbi:hypothetical protein EPO44_12750 [bacterium]|nr:MAG: hypothetical protein EPO44_12750 [bacterium]